MHRGKVFVLLCAVLGLGLAVLSARLGPDQSPTAAATPPAAAPAATPNVTPATPAPATIDLSELD